MRLCTFADCRIALLVQIPFGIVADKYGRRLVLTVALFGLSLAMTWTNIVREYSRNTCRL